MTNTELVPTLTLTAAAKMAGISTDSAKKFQKAGLLLPFVSRNGRRRYNERDVEHLRAYATATTKDGMSMVEMKRLFSLVPCWEVTNCSEDTRRDCPCTRGSQNPCWVCKIAQEDICQGKDCRTCPVYDRITSYNYLKGLYMRYVTSEVVGVV